MSEHDFLSGFLDETPRAETPDAPVFYEPRTPDEEKIVEALRTIFDPEIPVNIYELGLVYDVTVDAAGVAHVTMTLTTPHCPVAESMPDQVKLAVEGVDGISAAEVNLVWEPTWTMAMMSEAARLELGML